MAGTTRPPTAHAVANWRFQAAELLYIFPAHAAHVDDLKRATVTRIVPQHRIQVSVVRLTIRSQSQGRCTCRLLIRHAESNCRDLATNETCILLSSVITNMSL